MSDTTNTSADTERNERPKEILFAADLSVRDYFAVHAPIPLNDHRDWQQEAEIRYMYADAMLAEREKG